MIESRALTANEAAAVSRVPLRQVHRIIDAGLLEGAVETRKGARLIGGPALVALKLAYATADVLTPAARRRAVLAVLEDPTTPAVRDRAVTIEIGRLAAELREGLKALEKARAMVTSDPETLGGTPCFAGTRIPVHHIADMIANGDEPAAILTAYPQLDHARIGLAVVYAAAYPRRGRPRHIPVWRASRPKASKRLRVEDLPPVA